MAHNIEEKSRTEDVILDDNVSFDSLLLKDEISKGLEKNGFRKPSPIQLKAIPLGRCGFDLIVKSKSGTGKTLVFSVIALEAVNITKFLQAIIIVPTREIAVQIEQVLKSIGSFINGLRVESFIGGLPLEDDINKAKGTHIAVGAPGRLKHLITSGHLSIKHVKLFVLDEADKLMESSFQSDVTEIFNALPQRKQMITSSATYPPKLDQFLSRYMVNPTHVNAEMDTPMLLGLKHFVTIVDSSSNVVRMTRAKNELLIEILSKVSFTQCLVFSNYQTRAESISNYLNQKGWTASYISAAQSQAKRLEAVKDLKEFKNRILLSTDLTSRGIDAANVDLVINYDIPTSAVTYLHRMGRAGRYGSAGICINLALKGDELDQLKKIIGAIGSPSMSIPELPDLKGVSTLDLLNSDLKDLEQIQGLVVNSNNDLSSNIKDEVLELNHNNRKNEKNKSQTNQKTLSDELSVNENDAMNIINNSKKEVNDVCGKFSNLDTETLLLSLANGKGIEENAIGINCDDGEDDSGKKRKRCEKLSPPLNLSEVQTQKRKTETITNPVFCKNKALFSITKLLCNSQTAGDDTVSSISAYLNFIKADDDDFGEESHEEKTEIPLEEQIPESVPQVQKELSDGVMDDIFRVGYKYAVGLDKNHWLTKIPPEEFKAFQDYCAAELHENTDEDDEDDDEDVDDYNMEDFSLVNNLPSTSTSNFNPSIHQNHRELSVEQSEHFKRCYDECSDSLWQNGLTFESVDDFDYWYSNVWQQQLQSVRSYVQQNIYVDEMSNFRQQDPQLRD